MYPKQFEALVESLRNLPGVGLKTAERYAFQILEWDEEKLDDFIHSLSNIQNGDLKRCNICGNLSEGDTCEICKDHTRDESVICVVQTAKDVIAMEKTREFNGVYHVLNGVISTSKGILPDDINIASLMDRINDDTKEVILATNPTVEGETTALYISKLLENYPVTVTRIAHGLPMGGHLDYADELTLIKAIEGRNKM
ncbi:recombination mediator RecR [[Eubacterium] hominis]|uniref:recombination mediator RecR n=1 Tax=[Eubacterium] hominis TaxID=2764325 RepID=UPI003A4D770B